MFDVAVDCRHNSSTFVQWTGVILDKIVKTIFYIPGEFSHGFLVLSDMAEFVYKCTDIYGPTSEGGIPWDDQAIHVQWPKFNVLYMTNEKDKLHPSFESQKFEYFEKY